MHCVGKFLIELVLFYITGTVAGGVNLLSVYAFSIYFT